MVRKKPQKPSRVNEEKCRELDSHWANVMNLAREYGFILQAYGGVAFLATHKNQQEQYDEETYIRRQRDMNGIDIAKQEEPGP